MNDQTQGSEMALRATIADICGKRDIALATFTEAAETLERGYQLTAQALQEAQDAHHGREHRGGSHEHSKAFEKLHRRSYEAEKSIEAARKVIDARTWNFLLDHAGINALMDVQEKDAFRRDLDTEVPEATHRELPRHASAHDRRRRSDLATRHREHLLEARQEIPEP